MRTSPCFYMPVNGVTILSNTSAISDLDWNSKGARYQTLAGIYIWII